MSNENETSFLLLIMAMESAVSRVALKKKGKRSRMSKHVTRHIYRHHLYKILEKFMRLSTEILVKHTLLTNMISMNSLQRISRVSLPNTSKNLNMVPSLVFRAADHIGS